MAPSDPHRLLYGPYRPPRCRVGSVLTCELRGDMRVTGMSDRPIPWPVGFPVGAPRGNKGSPALIVCGGLAQAIRRESNLAVSRAWGVNPATVSKWRRALGVERQNEGTQQVWRERFPDRMSEEARARGVERAASPESSAKRSAALKGRKKSPEAVAKTAAFWTGRQRSPEHRRKISETLRRIGHRPPWLNPAWSAEEDELLGTMPDAEVAARTGRTVSAVGMRRRKLRIPSPSDKGARMRGT